jgi:hypothetical protein
VRKNHTMGPVHKIHMKVCGAGRQVRVTLSWYLGLLNDTLMFDMFQTLSVAPIRAK